ncbi:hypothetical protein L218DRAFT_965926 [Marasmius fiardii PR-910]|nr:hypothetical protein L218DRAFT_965926 [Marasmius fiardii PR-910]
MIKAVDSSTTAVLELYTSTTEEESTNFHVQTLVEGKTYPFGEKLALKTIDYYSALFCILKAPSCR